MDNHEGTDNCPRVYSDISKGVIDRAAHVNLTVAQHQLVLTWPIFGRSPKLRKLDRQDYSPSPALSDSVWLEEITGPSPLT